MNRKKLTYSLAGVIAGLALWLIYSGSSQPSASSDIPLQQALPATTEAEPTTSIAPQQKPKPRALPTVVAESATLVANAYQQEIKYPPYSRPLTNQAFDKLNPNHFYPNTLALDEQGSEISVSLEKYRFIYPEPIIIRLTGSGVESARVSLRPAGEKQLLSAQPMLAYDNYWQADLKGQRDFPLNMQALIEADVDGQMAAIVVDFKYTEAVATITHIGAAEIDGADMVLPLSLQVYQAGTYRIRANLFTANQQPIAQLTAKQKLSNGSEQLELRAHQSVLQGTASPYTLSTFVVERMSPKPGEPKLYGDSEIGRHVIEHFSPEALDQADYQPGLQEQQRLEFLKQMAGQ